MTSEKDIQTALSFHEKMDFGNALCLYEQIIKRDSNNFQVLNLIGLTYQQMGQEQEGLIAFERALKVDKNQALTHFSAGACALKLGQFTKALDHLNNALSLAPSDYQILVNKAIALHKLGFLELAKKNYGFAITINPQNAVAHFNLGCTLQEMYFEGAVQLAIKSYEVSISLNPQDTSAYNNLGNALKEQGFYPDAIRCFKSALNINPNLAVSYYNKGTTEFIAKSYFQATLDLIKAVELDPHSYMSWNNLGNSYKELAEYKNALMSYERVLNLTRVKPGKEIFYNTGIVQHELGLYEQAHQSFTQALTLEPSYTNALNARALTLRHLKQFDQSVRDFKTVLQIDPRFEYAVGNLLHTQMHIADWSSWNQFVQKFENSNTILNTVLNTISNTGFDRSLATRQLNEMIFNDQKVSHPFPVLALYDDSSLNLKASQVWCLDKHQNVAHSNEIGLQVIKLFNKLSLDLLALKKNQNQPRIRLAYLSADFHNHATAYLIAELLELHNRFEFEVFALSFGPKTKDEMQTRILRGVEHFINVSELSDLEIAQVCKSLDIDIAIDLKGYTLQSRFNIFIHRCAPIQVSYLGYPSTSGSSCMNYLIADRTCIPFGEEQFYTEKIVFMPNSYQVNDSKRRIKSSSQTRNDLGLPEDGFVFCCFNNTYKINPQTFETWMKILSQVDKSILWLLEDNETITKNLKASAQIFDINPDRLVFAKRVALDEHLGRHVHADLFLDTLPYNAHTTASDALWSGLPVLTLKGKSFAGRVASSLLNAVGLEDLVTESTSNYIDKAIHLALNPNELNLVKMRLHHNKPESALFNTKQFTLQLESAYKIMLERSLRGDAVDHIFV